MIIHYQLFWHRSRLLIIKLKYFQAIRLHIFIIIIIAYQYITYVDTKWLRSTLGTINMIYIYIIIKCVKLINSAIPAIRVGAVDCGHNKCRS